MLTSNSRHLLESIFCLQKMNEEGLAIDLSFLSELCLGVCDECDGDEDNDDDEDDIYKHKKIRNNMLSQKEEGDNFSDILNDSNMISEKEFKELNTNYIIVKLEANEIEDKKNIENICIFNDLENKDQSTIEKTGMITNLEEKSERKYTLDSTNSCLNRNSSIFDNFQLEFVENNMNFESNYNVYVSSVLKSLIPISKLDFTKEIDKRQVSIPESSKKHTLFIDLDETLIHSKFDIKNHESATNCEFFDPEINEIVKFKVYIRPNVKLFLEEVSKYFQIVAFTASTKEYADAVINLIDPNNKLFEHRLYRDSCIKVGRSYVKDLRIIKNRKMENMVILDNSLYSFCNQLSNGILIYSYYDGEDSELVNIQNYLLDYISLTDDVRFVNEQVFNFEKNLKETIYTISSNSNTNTNSKSKPISHDV